MVPPMGGGPALARRRRWLLLVGTGFAPASAFDCDAGLSLWETGWSLAKKDWCCKARGLACDLHQCQLTLADELQGADGWTDEKRTWCCEQKGVFCKESKENEESSGDTQALRLFDCSQ